VTEQEEVRFRETIERGLKILDKDDVGGCARRVDDHAGETAFKLYDTYGFPLDLTQVIAEERGLSVDVRATSKALEEQRARSEHSKVGEAAVEHVWREVLDAVQKRSPGGVKFVGYEREEGEGRSSPS
jgi:alanyl-tRNA synthetase